MGRGALVNLLFLHGPPACGKLTVARAIEARVGWPVFHNHLVVDAVSALFPFGSPSFVRLREEFWLAAFETAAAEGRSFIFTFAPERTVSVGFPERAVAAVAARGGMVRFVALAASAEVIATRVEDEARGKHGKLKSRALLEDLSARGVFDVAPLPAELTIDTGALSPTEAAERIVAGLRLAAG